MQLNEGDIDNLRYVTHTLGVSAAVHGNIRMHNLARQIENLLLQWRKWTGIIQGKFTAACCSGIVAHIEETFARDGI